MNHFFGRNLKLIRRAKGLSQAQLGKEMGKGQKTIGNWETGYSEPSLHELLYISRFFLIDLDSLLKRNLSRMDINLQPSQLNNKPDVNNTDKTKATSDDMRYLRKEEPRDEKKEDEIAWRDRYINTLETKLHEEIIKQIPQQVLQDMVSNLLAIQKVVTKLTSAETKNL